jgi:hypothetical protein
MPDQQTIPKDYQRIITSERHAVPGARRVGPADPNEVLSVTIRVRRRPDAPPLPDRNDPNRRPGAAMPRESFAGLYGADPAELRQVEDFARRQGLTVAEASVDRRTVAVSGTVAQMAQAFGVELSDYESPDGNYRGREGFVHLPTALNGIIEGVFGLDNRRKIGSAGLDWSSLGAPAAGIVGAPIATNDADGRLEVFVIDEDGDLWHIWQTAPNNGWSGWAKLPTIAVASSGPPGGAIRDADGRIEVFIMTSGVEPLHVWQTAPNNGWTTGALMGKPAGGLTGRTPVTRNADGRLEAFGMATDKKLWHSWQTVPNGGWSGWATLGGPPSPVNLGDPRVGVNHNGQIAVFVLAQDGNVYHIGQTSATSWGAWASLGQPGVAISNGAPFVGRNHDGRMELFATGVDGSVYHKWQTSPHGGWSGWVLLAPNPPAVQLYGLGAVGNEKDGCLSVFAIGSDGGLWNCRQSAPNNGWRPWLYLGSGPPSQAMNPDQIPAIGRNKDGRLEVFVVGADGAMWRIGEKSPDGPW